MKAFLAALALLSLAACDDIPTNDFAGDPSYMIVDENPMFCEGSRALIKVVNGRLNLWCADPQTTVITSLDASNQSFVGLTINEDALLWIARRKD